MGKMEQKSDKKKRVVILGALGNDFHVFNTVFRDNTEYEVVAFTMASAQNVGTLGEKDRCYPTELAGSLYPNGIPMVPEETLVEVNYFIITHEAHKAHKPHQPHKAQNGRHAH